MNKQIRSRYLQNEVFFNDDICKIALYNMKGEINGFTIIDSIDYDSCKNYKWCKKVENDKPYAVAMSKRKQIRLHRLIYGLPDSKIEIDHKNHDSLDNRRSNIRLVSSQQNKWNMQTPSHNTSGYKGVYNNNHKTPWVAQIKKNRKVHYLGVHKTAELAAKAYNKAAIKLFGEYACLNEVK